MADDGWRCSNEGCDTDDDELSELLGETECYRCRARKPQQPAEASSE